MGHRVAKEKIHHRTLLRGRDHAQTADWVRAGGGAGDGLSLRLTCFNQNDEEIRQVVGLCISLACCSAILCAAEPRGAKTQRERKGTGFHILGHSGLRMQHSVRKARFHDGFREPARKLQSDGMVWHS